MFLQDLDISFHHPYSKESWVWFLKTAFLFLNSYRLWYHQGHRMLLLAVIGDVTNASYLAWANFWWSNDCTYPRKLGRQRWRILAAGTTRLPNKTRDVHCHSSLLHCAYNSVSSVRLRLSQFSQPSFVKYMWGCAYATYPFLLWWLREYVYIIL